MAVRKRAGGALVAPLVVGLVIGAPAVPAFAATEITAPSDGAVVTGGSSVLITASLDLLESGALELRGPEDDGFHRVDTSFHTVDKESGQLQYRLDVRSAPNGTYTVHLTSQLLLAQGDGEHTFKLRVPPQPPEDLTAKVNESRAVLLRWKRGPEPDLAGYDVLSSTGDKLSSLSVGSACDGGSCAAMLDAPAGSAGEQVGFAVRARRHTAPSSNATVSSAPSKVVTQVPAPAPTVSSSPNPSSAATPSDGGTSPGSAGSGGGGLPAERPVPRHALPDLQPLASTSRLSLPDVTGAGSAGRNLPQLGNPAQKLAPSGPLGTSATSSNNSASGPMTITAMDPMQWWKTVALGLVLLLVTAHFGTWTRRRRPASARSGQRREQARARHGRGGGR